MGNFDTVNRMHLKIEDSSDKRSKPRQNITTGEEIPSVVDKVF